MKIAEKKTKIEALENLIFKKKQQTEKNTKAIEILELEYKRLNQSGMPMLLFVYQDDINSKFYYIYYCPDLDSVKLESSVKENSFLENTLDLREKFNDLVISKEDISSLDSKVIQVAINNVKSIINDAINFGLVKSWDEVRDFLEIVPNCFFTSSLDEDKQNDITLKRTYIL